MMDIPPGGVVLVKLTLSKFGMATNGGEHIVKIMGHAACKLRHPRNHVRTLLKDDPDTPTRTYAAQFLAGVAESAADTPLTEAAHALGAHPDSVHVDQVVQLLTERAAERPASAPVR